jgi:succinate dehydrogenase/fumarate reductase flavoprotein subunit
MLERLVKYDRGNENVEIILTDLQKAVGDHLMITRNAHNLTQLLNRIEELKLGRLAKVKVSNSSGQRRAIEIHNLLYTAELMTRAALMREESRGSHFREDFPDQNDKDWNTNIMFQFVNDEIVQFKRSAS